MYKPFNVSEKYITAKGIEGVFLSILMKIIKRFKFEFEPDKAAGRYEEY